MQRLTHLRVILETEPQSGVWNMAVDEALLLSAISSEVATLRWYQWKEPTVSLGYFQKSADFEVDSVLSQLPVVRRLSGGGAILHDCEWTYSLTVPPVQKLFSLPEELYDIVHGSLVASLNRLGFPIAARGVSSKLGEEPLLCFQRRDSHDLVVHGQKVVGSAQRRRRGAVLQHGSLILHASAAAPAVAGLADLCEAQVPPDLAGILAVPLAEAVAENWTFGELTEQEKQVAVELCSAEESRVKRR
ncbi:biotin/lipoate A/B protein ligase family protein [Schlesneria sp. DSM 10557]|uniref:lipoate--protein ligase family protein n=1 Tax=Schlesneria sp. DSM 10557 TaxID=3044399 RepID=UPI0035A1A367